jgi:four helix bundle protein
LTDQIRRSSRSIGAQIAEAWGKGQYIRHFLAKLTDADSEQLKTQRWVDVCGSCKYLKVEQVSSILHDLEEIGKMLNSMMAKAEAFCSESSLVREEQDEYFRSLTDV